MEHIILILYIYIYIYIIIFYIFLRIIEIFVFYVYQPLEYKGFFGTHEESRETHERIGNS